MEKPGVPEVLQAPAGEDLVLQAHASGFQIYVCRPGVDGQPAWILKAPEARLSDHDGNVIGTHFAGPTWRHNDGSQISASVAVRVEAPGPSAIPWLLLTVSGHSGSGIFSRVSSIQRINTVAGLPPAVAGCGGSHLEAEFRSPYSADYYFYARRA